MKRLALFLLSVTLATGAIAQDLDVVTITDQFNMGERGNNDGGVDWTDGNWGASNPTGTEFADYTGTDMSAEPTTAIRYINTWASRAYYGNSEVESPVSDITAGATNPDITAETLPARTANDRPGATGGSTAVLIADDTGFNCLFFGESNDRNYYVQVDMYCPNRNSAGGFEIAGLAARAGRDSDIGTTDPLVEPVEYTYNVDRAGSYCIFYDYMLNEVKAVKWTHGNGSGAIVAYDPASFTQFGETQTGITEGWHTFRIECHNDQITFKFDALEVASVTDTDYGFGRPALYYRENNTTPEYQAMFDNLLAGPTSPSAVSDWTLF